MAYRRTDNVIARLADTRRQILNAAREIVAEGGFAAAQMVDVAKRADVATGTLYRYFASKEELCRQVFREVSSRDLNMLASIAGGEGSPVEKLEAAIRTFASRALRGRQFAYALLAEPAESGVELERAKFRKAQAEIFAGLIADGVETGELACHDVEAAAACLAGAIPAALIGPLASGGLDERGDAVMEEIVRFCLAAVRA